MTTKRVVLYPTPENCQYQDAGPVPFSAFVSYMASLMKKLTATEIASTFVTGTNGLQVTYEHVLTPVEEYKAKLETVRALVQELSLDKIDNETTNKLLAALT